MDTCLCNLVIPSGRKPLEVWTVFISAVQIDNRAHSSGCLCSQFSRAEVDCKMVTVHTPYTFMYRAVVEGKNGRPAVLMGLVKSRRYTDIWLVISVTIFEINQH